MVPCIAGFEQYTGEGDVGSGKQPVDNTKPMSLLTYHSQHTASPIILFDAIMCSQRVTEHAPGLASIEKRTEPSFITSGRLPADHGTICKPTHFALIILPRPQPFLANITGQMGWRWKTLPPTALFWVHRTEARRKFGSKKYSGTKLISFERFTGNLFLRTIW